MRRSVAVPVPIFLAVLAVGGLVAASPPVPEARTCTAVTRLGSVGLAPHGMEPIGAVVTGSTSTGKSEKGLWVKGKEDHKTGTKNRVSVVYKGCLEDLDPARAVFLAKQRAEFEGAGAERAQRTQREAETVKQGAEATLSGTPVDFSDAAGWETAKTAIRPLIGKQIEARLKDGIVLVGVLKGIRGPVLTLKTPAGYEQVQLNQLKTVRAVP
ncbi:MAG: hypothetical protein ACI9WU_004175 [Myxococcota bacterium]|jgi:hypothetical protein